MPLCWPKEWSGMGRMLKPSQIYDIKAPVSGRIAGALDWPTSSSQVQEASGQAESHHLVPVGLAKREKSQWAQHVTKPS